MDQTLYNEFDNYSAIKKKSKGKHMAFTILVCLPFIIIAGMLLYNLVYENLVPDYMKDLNLPQGYVDSDGGTWMGKEIDEFYYYTYSAKPNLTEKYQLVNDENVEEILSDVRHYTEYGHPLEYQINLSEKVSVGDYFYKVYYDKNAKEIDYLNDHEQLYLYDIETDVLYFFYYCY